MGERLETDAVCVPLTAYPDLRHIFADGGYAGPKLRDAIEGVGKWTIQIVKRSDTAEGFEVIRC